ncbi:hypothetical protein Efla_007837 [Eimeria flavescens]
MASSHPPHGRNGFSATSKPIPVSSARHVKISSISAASRTQLHVDKLSGTPVPSISAHVIKTNQLISSPKQLVYEGTVNKNPITFLLDGGADHSIMSKAFTLTNWFTLHQLDPPIAMTFANSSKTDPAVSSSSEAYCNYVSTIQKLPEEAQPQAMQKEPKTLPTPRNHQHAIPLYPDAELTQPDRFLLPLIDVLIDKMSKPKVFSRLDLRKWFYQTRMADEDIFKTSSAVYMGYIVVHSNTLSSQHDHLRHVFQRLQENAFHLNLSKCSFEADCIDFLGLQISPAGVQPLVANVSSVLSMHSTFSSLTAFLSRTLSKGETNYPFIDKEWLAVMYALTKWRHYLQQRFCIRTDNKPPRLSIIRKLYQLQDRRAWCIELCMLFSLKIEHMSGKENVVAENHSPAAYGLALTAPETHARDALMSDIRRNCAGDPLYILVYQLRKCRPKFILKRQR